MFQAVRVKTTIYRLNEIFVHVWCAYFSLLVSGKLPEEEKRSFIIKGLFLRKPEKRLLVWWLCNLFIALGKCCWNRLDESILTVNNHKQCLLRVRPIIIDWIIVYGGTKLGFWSYLISCLPVVCVFILHPLFFRRHDWLSSLDQRVELPVEGLTGKGSSCRRPPRHLLTVLR